MKASKLVSLKQLCLTFCVNNLEQLLIPESTDESSESVEQENKVKLLCELPAVICDSLLDCYYKWQIKPNTKFLQVFSDCQRTHLSKLVLRRKRDQKLVPWMLEIFCQQGLTHLDIPVDPGKSCRSDGDGDGEDFSFQNIFGPLQKVRSTLKVLALRCIDSNIGNRITEELIKYCISEEERPDSSSVDPTLEYPNLLSLTLKNFFLNLVDPALHSTSEYNESQQWNEERNVKMQAFFQKVKLFRSVLHLDLMGSYLHNDCYFFLTECTKLTSLILTDVHDPNTEEHDPDDEGFMQMMNSVVKVKTLKHLDLSSNMKDEDAYQEMAYTEDKLKISADFLTWILNELPNLVSLELANTTLGNCLLKSPRESEEEYVQRCPAVFRRRFEYLGLWGCDVFQYRDIAFSFPAQLMQVRKLAGEETKEQVLVALHSYVSRPSIMKGVVIQLITAMTENKWEEQSSIQWEEVLKDILNYIHESGHRNGWICLFNVLQRLRKEEKELDQWTRCEVLQLALVTMEATIDQDTLKLCLYNLAWLDIPYDALCCYVFERFTKCLLSKLRLSQSNTLNQKFLLGQIHDICRADYREKQTAAKLGVIDHLYEVISRKLAQKTCDTSLERAWSCLWSLTDEMPETCHLFMENKNAVELFFGCIEAFKDSAGLMRKLTGLMANVSEVPHLRPLLMTDAFISFFVRLLKPADEIDIDISYHSAGILSEIAGDGEEAWLVESPSRSEVLATIVRIVESWDINIPRKIKYSASKRILNRAFPIVKFYCIIDGIPASRAMTLLNRIFLKSLCPLIRMAQCYDVPEAQLWATWALCNLIKVKGERYIPMLIREKGVAVLKRVTVEDISLQESKLLASMALEEYHKYRLVNRDAE